MSQLKHSHLHNPKRKKIGESLTQSLKWSSLLCLS
jgi:hypothetical protein